MSVISRFGERMRADSIAVEATGRNAGARYRQADEKVAGMGLA